MPELPTDTELLYLQRLGVGYTPDAFAQLRAAGGPEAWLASQLAPASVPESPKLAEIEQWFSHLRKTPKDKHADHAAKVRYAWVYANDFGNYSMLRQIYSRRTVLERMTAFWSDALHIRVGHDQAWVYRYDYDAVIRRHGTGRFEDLLRECSLHPAMRVYLDNWRSVRNRPNENQGRELLELHTVTPRARYTEAMVKDSAKLLSGYTVDWGKSFEPYYDSAKHTTGPVSVLGFSTANASANGEADAVAYLRYLAHHPETARTIARRLATAFVSDHPSASLVEHLAGVYLAHDTSIGATLLALARSAEFAASSGAKVRNPVHDLVHTARVLRVEVLTPTNGDAWANAANWVHGAGQLYEWPRPDGAPLTNAPWSSPARIFRSFDMHTSQAAGWWPKGADYRKGTAWLPPATPIRFDQFVDLLCRQWFGRAVTPRQLTAAVQATGTAATALIGPNHAVARWKWPSLAAALLDSPDHMSC